LKNLGRTHYLGIWIQEFYVQTWLCSQAPVAQAWSLSYLGGWDQKDNDLRPAQANSALDHHLQNNQNKMDCWCG
jgi:hypothetical protein